MKKTFLTAAFFLVTFLTVPILSSCGAAGGGSLQTIGKIANVASTAQEISNVLGPVLGLKSKQKSSITDIFSNYIGGTNDIAPLAKTDKSEYKGKLKSLNKGTLSKINNTLTVAQYAKLLGLGKKNSNSGSLVDKIQDKSGKSLSKNATNVLSGLLLNGLK